MSSAVQSRAVAALPQAATGPAARTESISPRVASDRIPALDGIRGIAIILVLIFHVTGYGLGLQDLPNSVVGALTKWGWVGVDLFFVLSGYLITGILCDAKGSAGYFRNFYARRAVRIFPAYYLMLAVLLLVVPMAGFRASETAQATVYGPQWIYWSYTSNFYCAFQSHSEGWLGHTWSLAIEEQFYLLWPALIYLFDRRSMIRVCAGIIIGALVLRSGLLFIGSSIYSVYFLTFTHLDPIATGALTALLVRQPGGARFIARISRYVFIAAPAGMVAIYAGKASHREFFALCEEATKFSLLGLWFGAIVGLSVTASASSALNRVLGTRPLTFFGRHSYGFYLYHLPLIAIINDHVTRPLSAAGMLLVGAAYVSSTIALGWLSWNLFEKHCLKLKRLFPMEHATA